MTVNGSLYERPTWGPYTRESAGSAWPTATGHDAKGDGYKEANLNREAKMWPTATSKGNYNKAGLSKNSGNGLATAAILYPTPAATSYGTNQGGAAGRVGPVRPSLEVWARFLQDQRETGQESQTSSTRRLNPAFVCWLMGFPWWWTRAEPISCAAAEMRSYLSRLRSLLESF